MRVVCGTWRVWVAVAVVLTAAVPARAFYWGTWPGSKLSTPPTLVFPTPLKLGSPPPIPPPPELIGQPTPTQGPTLPVNQPPPLGPPEQAPEPATGVLGLLGFGTLVVMRRWRRNSK
jgi:hypothetical protein